MPELSRRPAAPADYDRIIEVLDDWFQRPMTVMLPRLFLDHFFDTSRVIESADGTRLHAFLVGFLSPAQPTEAYIHFVGVDPALRGQRLAAGLYEEFFDLATANGRSVVRAITSPVNTVSLAFHRSMGFEASMPPPGLDEPVRLLKQLREPTGAPVRQ